MSDIRKTLNIINEMTSAGAVATGPATNLFMKKRTDEYAEENASESGDTSAPQVLEYGNWENSALTTSKKLKQTRKKASKAVKRIYDESIDGVAPSTKMFTSEGATKTRNPVAKAAQRVAKGSGKHKNPAKTIPRKQKYKPVYEEENLSEMDLIVNPASKSKLDLTLVSKDRAHHDHEVEMARGDLFQAAKNAAEVLKLIKDRSEMEGLEGWVQEKIVKASDYLNTIREYLQNKSVQHRLQQADSMELEEDAGEQTYPPAPDWLKEILAKPEFQIAENIAEQDVTEGFKNTYNVGDRVETSMGSGVITTVSKNINIDGKVKVKLDDPSRAGEDGKYKDEFVFTTNMLKHLLDQDVTEGLEDETDPVIGSRTQWARRPQPKNDTAAQRQAERDKQRTTSAKKQHDQAQRKGLKQDKDGTYYAKEGVAEGSDKDTLTQAVNLYREFSKKYPHKIAVDKSAKAHDLDPNKLNNYIDHGKYHSTAKSEQGVAKGSEKHKQSRLWAMISDYEQRAKATKNDIKKQHYMKMADELRGKLKTSDDQEVTEARAGESKYWRVEQSEATGRYYVVKGYQKRTIWSSKSGACDFNSKAAAEKKAAELNQKEGLKEGLSDVVKGIKRKVAGKTGPKDVEHTYARIARRDIEDANKLNNQAAFDARDKSTKRWEKVNKVVNKESVAEDKDSIIDKCASLAAKYFNSEGLQREYDIDEFIKNNAGTDQIINKCASLAAKYFNSDGLQNQYDIDEYIKANVKQDVTKDKPSDSK